MHYQFDGVEIPYGAYWSTPFVRWQGSLQHLHSLELAAHVAKTELAKKQLDAGSIDYGVVGITVAQYQSFFGAPWPLYQIGLKNVAGPVISQACATGPRALLATASEVQLGMASCALALCADRTSNGPHLYYPAPGGTGGTGASEDQVLLSFSSDPVGKHTMLRTAENVASKHRISTGEQHDVVLRRYAQYQDALRDDRAFLKRYMTLPFSVPKPNFKGSVGTLEGDEGVFATSAEALGRLSPVLPGGTVTFGGQTHPADGNCGLIVTTPAKAGSLSSNPHIRIRLLGFGQARTELAHMPEAPVAATARALDSAGVSIDQVKAVKSHNPFAVNDIVFARATGYPLKNMNNYGCSLIWGHPHAATGLRAIIELIEELALIGGGLGLFQGCAAGDSSLAVVIEVTDR